MSSSSFFIISYQNYSLGTQFCKLNFFLKNQPTQHSCGSTEFHTQNMRQIGQGFLDNDRTYKQTGNTKRLLLYRYRYFEILYLNFMRALRIIFLETTSVWNSYSIQLFFFRNFKTQKCCELSCFQGQRNWFFDTKSIFLIPIPSQPDGVNHQT